MNLEQIDKALADWQGRIALGSSNLLELDDNETYKRLRGDLGAPPLLTGITKTRVEPALNAVRELWRYLQLIQDVVGRAAEMRKNMPRLWAEKTLTEIEQLLQGPSITLAAVTTPLAHRGLLSVSHTETRVTPAQLLSAMLDAFNLAVDAILEVEAAWKTLEPALTDVTTEAERLQKRAAALGEQSLPELTAVQQRARDLLKRVAADPLGVTGDLSRDITPLVERLRARLDELERQRESARAGIAQGRNLLKELADLQTQAAEALETSRLKVADPTGLKLPPPASAVTDLSNWLDTLENAAHEGRWNAARVGLDRWLQTARGTSDAIRASAAANRAPLEALAELRGRLSSLRAKAQSYAARGVTLPDTVWTLAGDAERCLQRRPTPLTESARLVEEYESLLARTLR